ncbi:MAG: peptidyl-prolyl cis-trans isomerase [Oscillospiraceae bacterium]|nr:peptidyl-prolyl cis-trans isomerase [Oscillospiraceae bacterium]
MSASREKKNRQQQAVNPTAAAPETKKGMSKSLKKILAIVVTIVVIAAVVFFTMLSAGFFEANTTAATVGTHKLSPAEVNYWLSDTYAEEQAAMAYLIDEEQPLSEQEYPQEGFDTWYDYMLDLALNKAANTYEIYDEAIANGFTLTDETKESIDSQLETLSLYGSMYGYTNASSYLAAMYGPGSKVSNYEDYLTVNYTAQEYTTAMYAEKEYTQEELDAFYAENADTVDTVGFRVFELAAEVSTDDNGAETVTEEALAAAEEKAIAMADAAKGDEAKFLELAVENTPEDLRAEFDADANTMAPNMTKADTPEMMREWLSDDARAHGDVYVVENDTATGFYVIFFREAVDMDISLPSVRHILVSAEDPTDADSMAAAKAEAESILAEYEAGEQTEEAFAALADERTADTGSAGNGGLYEDIIPGQMVTAFNDWCFSIHNEGDTDVIETEYGYHVMYYCGSSLESYRDIATEAAKRESEYTAWEEAIEESADYTLVSSKYINVI